MPRSRFETARPGGVRRIVAAAAAALGVVGLVQLLSPAAADAVVPECSAIGLSVDSLGGPNFYIDSGTTPSFRSGYTGYRITDAGTTSFDDLYVGLSNFTGGALGLAAGQSSAQRVGALAPGDGGSRFWYLTATGTSATAQQHTVTVYDHDPGRADSTALCTTTGGFDGVQSTISANANKVTAVSVSGGAPQLGSQFTVTVNGNTGTIGSGLTNDAESLWMSPAVAESWPASAFRLVGTSLTIAPTDGEAAQTYDDILRIANLGSASRDYTATYTFQAVGFTTTATALQPVQEIASGTQVKHTGSYPASIPPITPPVNDLSTALTATPTTLDLGGGDVDVAATVSGTAGAELDGVEVDLPADASVVPGTTTWGGEAASDPVMTNGHLVVPGPFVVGSGNHLGMRLHFGATPGTRTVDVMGLVGPAKIGSSPDTIDGSNPASASVEVDSAPSASGGERSVQTGSSLVLSGSELGTDADGDDLTVTSVGTPTGGGSVSLSDGELTYVAGDTPGDDTVGYTLSDGRGGDVEGTLTVHVTDTAAPEPSDSDSPAPTDSPTDTASPAPTDSPTDTASPTPAAQAIDFSMPETLLGTAPYQLSASANSGLPVTFSVDAGSCAITQGQLVPAGAGSCTVVATQAGDTTYLPADSVHRTVTFIEPGDDAYTVPGAHSARLDVLANDPDTAALSAVSQPAHGTASVVDGQVAYRPTDGFRGPDTFDYTVTEQGRTAVANVRVTVENVAPVLAGGRLGQLAGTTRTVTLDASDANGDPLTLHAVSADKGVSVRIDGRRLRVTAEPRVSGVVNLTVTARDDAGGQATSTITDRVSPPAPVAAIRRIGPTGTTITWSAAPTTAALYDVLLDGHRMCHTRATSCHVDRLLSSTHAIVVRTLGKDHTRSGRTQAPLRGHGRVLIATAYFASGSDVLTKADRTVLAHAVSLVRGSGFAKTSLAGYTDSDGGIAYNMALSHRRAAAVRGYLLRRVRLVTRESWHGETDPAATNRTSSGKALNRRVEVAVRY